MLHLLCSVTVTDSFQNSSGTEDYLSVSCSFYRFLGGFSRVLSPPWFWMHGCSPRLGADEVLSLTGFLGWSPWFWYLLSYFLVDSPFGAHSLGCEEGCFGRKFSEFSCLHVFIVPSELTDASLRRVLARSKFPFFPGKLTTLSTVFLLEYCFWELQFNLILNFYYKILFYPSQKL